MACWIEGEGMRESLPRARRDFLASIAAGGVVAALTLSGSAKALGIAPLRLSNADWRKRLSPAAFAVLREAATEPPFSSPLNHEHRRGIFACAGCALPLYPSTTKFDSGTGWPSFYDHLPGAIETRADTSLGMVRTEVRCARCGGHLGHVFRDGPPPTLLRYCMNGVALQFRPA
jgi:peptide-methionine (R)-S-oxide reductase